MEPRTIPPVRIEGLSDLVFGLALSIGALTLIARAPTDTAQVGTEILAFLASFLILINLWLTYSEIAAYQRVETRAELWLNITMLMGVALEPYLFNLLVSPTVSGAAFLDTASQYYALDIGAVLLVQAAMSALNFRKGLVPEPGRKHSGELAGGLGISGAIFLVSAIPLFGTVTLFSVPLRFLLWGSIFARRLGQRAHPRPSAPIPRPPGPVP